MALGLSDLVGVVAYPSAKDLDRALELGIKATGASSALGTGKVVSLTEATGYWAQGTSDEATRCGVIPKLYWGKDVNTDSSIKVTVLTGAGAEVYVESSGTILPGDRVQRGNGGTVKAWATGKKAIGVYKGHYNEGSGHGMSTAQNVTTAVTGEAVRISLLEGDDVT
jgi:hypothetical protein